MAYDPKKDNFIPPCDLCGGFRFETLRGVPGQTVRRCCECGLVSVEGGPEANGNGSAGVRQPGQGTRLVPFLLPFKRALERTRSGVPSVLLIGAESLPFLSTARRAGAKVTVLLEPGVTPPTEVVAHETSIEFAPFIPEQFDVIVCAGYIESVETPSLLFERAKNWLMTGGVLIVGTRNAGSLAARLWRARWLRQNAHGVEHLLSVSTISRYGAKFGFEVGTIRARSTARLVRRVLSTDGSQTLLARFFSLPVAATSNLLNLGDELWVELVKRGVTVRPIVKSIEEEEQSPGLAPAALYTGMQREAVLLER